MSEAKTAFEQEVEQQVDREARRALRAQNVAAPATRPKPEDRFFASLDASIKKNSAFVKKLRDISDKQRDALLADLRQLKAHNYITEAVAAIGECKLKQRADIDAAVQICSVFHQRYSEFTPLLQSTLLKALKIAQGEKEPERLARLAKQRTTMRFVAELFLAGIFTDGNVVYQPLKELLTLEKDPFSNVSVAVSFAKYNGMDFTGIIPTSMQQAQSTEKKTFEVGQVLTAKQQEGFAELLRNYFTNIVAPKVLEDHKALRQMEKDNFTLQMTKGELSDENKAAYEKALKNYDKVFNNAQTLSECVDLPMPELPVEELPTRVSSGGMVARLFDNRTDQEQDIGVWDDEDMKSFYEDTKDLKAYLPAVLMEQESSKHKKIREATAVPTEAATPSTAEESNADTPPKKSDEDGEDYASEEQLLAKKLEATETKQESDSGTSSSIDQLCARLPSCVNRDMIDKATEEFCYISSRTNRRKLLRCLFQTSRGRFDLIPHYCRMIATLNRCFDEIGELAVETVDEEFNYYMRKREETHLEAKFKTIRFIGELTKFGVYPVSSTFVCMKRLLDEFIHHNIDVLCCLLENCGRFLKRTFSTEVRMTNMLELLQRKKNVAHLDPRQKLLVENAYYQCNPPEKKDTTGKVRPPLNEFVRQLLYVRVNRRNVDHILDLIRRLDWNDPKMYDYVLMKFAKIWKVRYGSISHIASIAAGLMPYHRDFAVDLVDCVLEEIRVGLEQNNYRHNQRRVSAVKYLAELYNFEMVDSLVIFDTLHSILSFGHELGWPDPEKYSYLDPPQDYFRCRLVCTILDTCGEYFSRGSSKIKLNSFLVYFQRYMLAKGDIPQDVEFMVSDTIEVLRPKFQFFATLEEAKQAVANLEKEALQEAQFRQSGLGSYWKEEEEEEGEVSQKPRDKQDDEEDQAPADGSESSSDEDDSEEGDITEEEEAEDVVIFRDGGDTASKKSQAMEDEEFDKEFAKMVSEGFEAHRRDVVRASVQDVAIPKNVMRGRDDAGNAIFTVLTKKSNRQLIRSVVLPADNVLAVNLMNKKEEEREEQKEMKRLVLGLAAEVDPSASIHYSSIDNVSARGGAGSQQRRQGPSPPSSSYVNRYPIRSSKLRDTPK